MKRRTFEWVTKHKKRKPKTALEIAREEYTNHTEWYEDEYLITKED